MPAQLKRRLFIFLLIVLLIAGGFFAQWFFKGRFYESTDNAYVQGEITRVSSQLGARIDQVLVQDNQHVEKGQLLIKLEGDDFHLAVDRANAPLATRQAERLQAQSKLTQQASLIAGQAERDCASAGVDHGVQRCVSLCRDCAGDQHDCGVVDQGIAGGAQGWRGALTPIAVATFRTPSRASLAPTRFVARPRDVNGAKSEGAKLVREGARTFTANLRQ